MKLLRLGEVAAALNLHPATVRKMAKEGRLPVVHPTGSRMMFVRPEDLQALLAVPSKAGDGRCE